MDLAIIGLSGAAIIGFIISTVIPLVSSLISKEHWPQEVTGIITLFLAAVTGFLTEWLHAGSMFAWQAAIVSTLVSFVIAVLSHYGLWKDTTTTALLLSVGSKPEPLVLTASPADVYEDAAPLASAAPTVIADTGVLVGAGPEPVTHVATPPGA